MQVSLEAGPETGTEAEAGKWLDAAAEVVAEPRAVLRALSAEVLRAQRHGVVTALAVHGGEWDPCEWDAFTF